MHFAARFLFFCSTLISSVHCYRIQGRLTCFGKPISRVSVALMRSGLFLSTQMDTTTTDEDGIFVFAGVPGTPYFILPLYTHSSDDAEFSVIETALFPEPQRSGNIASGTGDIDMGDVEIDTRICKIYTSMYDAHMDLLERANVVVPFPVRVTHSDLMANLLAIGPVSYYDRIILPSNFDMTPAIAKRQLAQGM